MLSDIKRNVLTTYKADTSQMKREIGELQDKTKKLGDEQKKTHESFDKFLGTATKLAGVVAGASLVFDSFNHAIKDARLSTAAMGVDIDKLSTAAGGMKTRMQLLQDAAKFNASAFKLTGEQMATAERAMRAFTNAGFDQEEATQKVTDAIVKLEADGLKDFGVRVREATSDADKFNAIMESLAQVGGKVRDGQLSAAEGAQAASIKLQDSWDKLKTGLGEVAIAFTPVIEALAAVVGLAGDIAKYAGVGAGKILEETNPWDTGGAARSRVRAHYQSTLEANAPRLLLRAGGGDMDPRDTIVMKTMFESFNKARVQYIERNKDRWQADAARRLEAAALASAQAEARSTLGSATMEGGNFSIGATSSSLGELHGSQWERWQAESDVLKFDLEQFKGAGPGANKTLLEKTFGPLEDFNGYTKAFEALSGAVGSAMGAWIDGSTSAAEAFKGFIAQAVKGLAIQMSIEAVKHGAYALGSLAMKDFAGALLHGKAALAFSAGAVLAGAGAKALGGGGGGAPSAGGAAPTYNSSREAPPERRDRIIIIGNDFIEGGPRQRQLWAERLMNQAMESGGNPAVRYE